MNTTYYYKATSCNIYNNCSSSNIQSFITTSCAEDWGCGWTSCYNDYKTYLCVDANRCGTFQLLSEDNGSTQSCDTGSSGGSSSSSSSTPVVEEPVEVVEVKAPEKTIEKFARPVC